MQITLAVLTDELLSASKLSRYNIDIAALSETRLADEGSLNEMASGYTFFWKGLPTNSQRIHGVGFAIRTKLLQTLPESPVAISERLMTLRIPSQNIDMPLSSARMLQQYHPTMRLKITTMRCCDPR